MDCHLPTATLSPNYQLFSYGFINKGSYFHRSKRCEIQSVTFNSKTGEYIIIDSRGINKWVKNFATDTARRILDFESYEFNAVRIMIHCSKYNVYFALSKGYRLQVLNLNFHETFSLDCDSTAAHYICLHELRGELVAVGQSCIRIWKYGEVFNKKKPTLSCHGILLKCEIETPENVHISKVEIDHIMDRLYCIFEKEIWCYDMDGRFIFKVENVSATHATSCVFSPSCQFLAVGSMSGDIHVCTVTGGVVHTFSAHSRMVTGLLIHPSDSQIVITSSLDGYIKLLSLDTMEEIYAYCALSEGVHWMGLRNPTHIHCASNKSLEVIDLNYLCGLWAQMPYQVKKLNLVKSTGKSDRVVAVNEDCSLKLFSKRSGRALSTVMPPPSLDPLHEVISFAYDLACGLVYLLIDNWNVWVYTSKTDPACRIATWKMAQLCNHELEKKSQGALVASNELNTNEIPSQLTKSDADQCKCNCLCVLDFEGITEIGNCGIPLNNAFRPLLCGMENGSIVFVKTHRMKGKNRNFKITNGALCKLQIDFDNAILTVLSKGKDCYYIHVLQASTFTECFSTKLPYDLSALRVKNNFLGIGFESGIVGMFDIRHSKHLTLPQKREHVAKVVTVDFDNQALIMCSAGADGFLKLWNRDKVLLCDIQLDNTLSAVSFLNTSRDIILGFKSHIYYLSSAILERHGILDAQDSHSDSDDDSVVYENPYVRFDFKKQPPMDETTMENYLVPYSYLNLDVSFLRDSYTNIITDQFELADLSRKNSTASSSVFSFASTAVYESMEGSLAGDESDIDLPYCGTSPTPSVDITMSQPQTSEMLLMCESETSHAQVKQKEDNFAEGRNTIEQKSNSKMLSQAQPQSLKFSHDISKKLDNMKISGEELQRIQKRRGSRAPSLAAVGGSVPMPGLPTSSQQPLPTKKKRSAQTKKKKTKTNKMKAAKQTEEEAKTLKDDGCQNEGLGEQIDLMPQTELVTLSDVESENLNTESMQYNDDVMGSLKDQICDDMTDGSVNCGKSVSSKALVLSKVSEINEQDSVFNRTKLTQSTSIESTLELIEPLEIVSENILMANESGYIFTVEAESLDILTAKRTSVSEGNLTNAFKKCQSFEAVDVSSAETETSQATIAEVSSVNLHPVVHDETDPIVGFDDESVASFAVSNSTSSDDDIGESDDDSHIFIVKRKKANQTVPSRVTKTVNFTPAVPITRKKVVPVSRVVPVSKIQNELGVKYNTGNAPLSILSLAKRRNDERENKLTHEKTQQRITSKRNIVSDQTEIPQNKQSEIKAVRIPSQHSDIMIGNQQVKKVHGTPTKSIEESDLMSSDHSQNNSKKGCGDLMKFCVSAFKKPSKRTQDWTEGYSQDHNYQERRPSLSASSVMSGSTISRINMSDGNYQQSMTPSVTIYQRPCSPVSQVSGSVDTDKLKIDYEIYQENGLQSIPPCSPQRHTLCHHDHYLDKEVAQARFMKRCSHKLPGRAQIYNSPSFADNDSADKDLYDDNDPVFNRIKSAGLRNELRRRKTLSQQRSARHASARERRSEQTVLQRRCTSASPALFRPQSSTLTEESGIDVREIYEYNPPTPLPVANRNSDSKSPYHATRKLGAKIAGQPFRLGEKFNLDEDAEKTLISFATSLVSKTAKPVLLPKPKATASIPAKCHEFILLEDAKTEKKPKLTRIEHQILSKRFQPFNQRDRPHSGPLVSN